MPRIRDLEPQNVESIINLIKKNRLLAIIRTENSTQAIKAAHAVIAGGFRSVEITLTVPDGYAVIAELARSREILIGAGTVLDADMALKAISSGAKFLVSPHTDSNIIQTCKGHEVVAIPGAATATEVLNAHRLGADIVKIFPASSYGGPSHLRFLKGPLPFVRLLPTGGIDIDNVSEYFAAGAFAVGVTNKLINMEFIRKENYSKITELAEAFFRELSSE